MNKQRVNDYLTPAVNALIECKIAVEENKSYQILKTYRANISGFGAAVAMGSFKAAVAFYSSDARSKNESQKDDKVYRSRLIQAMDMIVEEKEKPKDAKDICKKILQKNSTDGTLDELCEKYLDASIALKLAMNSFDLIDPKKGE